MVSQLFVKGGASSGTANTVNMRVRAHGRRDGFVWVRCAEVAFFSYDLTSNESIQAFRKKNLLASSPF